MPRRTKSSVGLKVERLSFDLRLSINGRKVIIIDSMTANQRRLTIFSGSPFQM